MHFSAANSLFSRSMCLCVLGKHKKRCVCSGKESSAARDAGGLWSAGGKTANRENGGLSPA